MERFIRVQGLIDISIGQTTSTLLAKGWNNALLVNVDNKTLTKMVNNEKAMEIINSIESFRKKKDDKINKTIISQVSTIKKLQTKRKIDEGLTGEERKELSKEQREYNKKRQLVREKLLTLATRIPLFMYLTDYREEKLTDVIMNLEPELFKKVTGLSIEDFELLLELGLFNSELMNDVVYKFRNYEESSMSYSGINRHAGEKIAGFDTVEEDKTYKKKVFTPKPGRLRDSKVYLESGVYKLPRHSKIRRKTRFKITRNEMEFATLIEAAVFISGNSNSDETFFMD